METYDFASKHLYRQRRESAIERMAPGNKYTRRVAYLDTAEALDTISYLQRGYQPKNLWAINRNPAVVAHLTMKLDSLGLPRVNTVGMEFEEALERRVPEVDIVDFDGMSCLHGKLVQSLSRIIESRPKVTLGMTLLAARETGLFSMTVEFPDRWAQKTIYETSMLNRLEGIRHTSFGTPVINIRHLERIWVALYTIASPYFARRTETMEECKIHFTRVLWDTYKSISNQTMCWFIVNSEPHHKLSGKELTRIRKETLNAYVPQCIVKEVTEEIEKEIANGSFV